MFLLDADWALHAADPDLLGGLPARVGHGVLHDPKARKGHEVDVAVVGIAQDSKPPLLAIGEATWNDVIGAAHIDRLEHIRTLKESGRYDTSRVRLMLSSGGNDRARAAAAEEGDIVLVDLDTLYGRT